MDDDPDVLIVLSAVLSRQGFQVLSAPSADQALVILASGEHVDVVISDYAMVGMNGAEFLTCVKGLHGNPAMLMITGLRTVESSHSLPPEVEVLRKPFRTHDLVNKVVSLCTRNRPLRLSDTEDLP